MCELSGPEMDKATAPRDWYAVLDRDGFGDVYTERSEAERDVETFNERVGEYAPYRIIHLREVRP